MPAFVYADAAYRPSDQVSLYSAETWRSVYQAYVRTGEAWKPLWSYTGAPRAGAAAPLPAAAAPRPAPSPVKTTGAALYPTVFAKNTRVTRR